MRTPERLRRDGGERMTENGGMTDTNISQSLRCESDVLRRNFLIDKDRCQR